MSNILVITPTYNEVGNINNFINTILGLEEKVDILVVDDSSPDGTGNVISQHIRYQERLYLLSRPTKINKQLIMAIIKATIWLFDKEEENTPIAV